MIYLAVAKFNDSCGSGKPLVLDSGLESGKLTSPDYPSKYAPHGVIQKELTPA